MRIVAFPVDDNLIVYGKVSIESGRECMGQLLSQNIDAVFAMEDFTAPGAIQSIKAANKKFPAILPLLVLPMKRLVSILHPLYQP